MKKHIACLLVLSLLATSLHADSSLRETYRGQGAGYSTRDATVLSMMGWGVGLAVGIAVLSGILTQNTGASSSSDNSNNNNSNTHSH